MPTPDRTAVSPMDADGRDMLFAAGVGLALFLTVVVLWPHPRWTFLLLALILAVQILYRPRAGDKVTMLAAALLGTAGEALEVHLGEWTYHGPELVWGMPIWIPLIWANLFGLFRRLTRSTLYLLGKAGLAPDSVGRRRLFQGLGALFLLYAVPALLLMEKMREVVIFYGVFIAVAALLWNRERDRALLYWGGALGTIGEFVCVQLGYWHYYNPYFSQWGVDLSLPLDWGLSAIILDRIGRLWEMWLQRRPNTVEGINPDFPLE